MIKKWIFFLFVIACLISCGFSSSSQQEDTSVIHNEIINDGPYIFRDMDKLSITYIFNNEIVTREVRVKGFSKSFISIQPFGREYIIPAAIPRVEASVYKGVDKIAMISDIHGRMDSFKNLLINNRITTPDMTWSFGKGHLVIVGDVFDRGDNVTEILWIIYHLEQQAEEKGGKVHYILGNHELLVLNNDLRYIHPKYSYATEQLLKIPLAELYGPQSILGQWLRTKNAIMKINDILFVHGGIHPHIVEKRMNMDKINKQIRQHLTVPTQEKKKDEMMEFLFFKKGPLWFRGFFPDIEDVERVSPKVIDKILKFFEAHYIIVGHTTVDHITQMYGGKVIGINTGIEDGKGEALLWENGVFFKLSQDGTASPL